MATTAGPEGLSDEGHIVVRRMVNAPADAVWDVLADGWLYATWVVGASRLRDVDAAWPEQGSRLHHSVGLWPAVLDDQTQVLHSDPGARLVLKPKGRPFGEAIVDLRLLARGDRCELVIVEDAVSGPGLLVPRPLRQPLIAVRNKEALHRLALLAEGRSVGVSSEDTSK